MLSTRTYVLTWIGLIALATLTLALSFLHLPTAKPYIAIGIAFAQVLLLASFFMHVRSARGSIWLTIAAAALFMALLIGFSFFDIQTRVRPEFRPPNPSEWAEFPR